MRNLILRWLFGTDDIKYYMELLSKCIGNNLEQQQLVKDHIETLEQSQENLRTILKLIKICENHGIDVDEEIEHVRLDDTTEVSANETLG